MIQKLDKESRLKLLRQAPPEIQELYGGEENGRVLYTAAEKIGALDELAYNTFALTIGDIILGTHPKESLGQMLKDRMELTDEQIKLATTELNVFLSKVPQQKVNSPPIVVNAPREGLVDQAIVEEKDTTPSTQTHDVKPLRTFAEDVEFSRVHGYGSFKSGEVGDTDDTPVHRSNQDDVLGRR